MPWVGFFSLFCATGRFPAAWWLLFGIRDGFSLGEVCSFFCFRNMYSIFLADQ